jgi:DNA-binding NarL/FixJ family response regulator
MDANSPKPQTQPLSIESAAPEADGNGGIQPEVRTTGPVIGRLTMRERQVLSAAASGETNKAIAQQLGISESTVKDHLKTIFLKLGVESRTQAAAVWLQARR